MLNLVRQHCNVTTMNSSSRHFRFASIVLCIIAGQAQASPETPKLPLRELQTLAAVYGILQSSFVEQPDGKKLIVAAIRGMTHDLDPDGGEYFTEEEVAAHRDASPPGWGTVGLEINPRGGELVLAPIVGGPAAAAGLRLGDRLLSIDGKSVISGQVESLSHSLRGPVRTKVTVGFARAGAPPMEVAVERENFEPKVTVSRLEQDIALLVLPRFRGGMLEEATSKLQREWDARPFRSLILDLRGNPGGLLEVAFGVAAMFLPPDAILATTMGKSPTANREYRVSRESYARGARRDPLDGIPAGLKTIPLVVLVDEGTASGAEIVVAALKDHRRATLIGRRTFGRGSVQTVTRLPGAGAIKYTTAYWTSPSGSRIHDIGVSPQIEVRDPEPAGALAEATARLSTRE